MKPHECIHVCSFSALPDVKRKTTYEALKAAAIAAGRFSVWEATANKRAAELFALLWDDPDLVVTADLGYPWTSVKLRERTP